MNNNLFLIDLNHIIYRYYYTMGFKENIDYILTDKKIKILNNNIYLRIFSFLDKISTLGQVIIFGDSKLVSRNKYFEITFPMGTKKIEQIKEMI